jgi:hypothetical protein
MIMGDVFSNGYSGSRCEGPSVRWRDRGGLAWIRLPLRELFRSIVQDGHA